MFSKIKHLHDLRQQAKKLQNELAQEIVEITVSGVTIKMNGNQEILALSLSDELVASADKRRLEKALTESFSDAMKKLQRRMAEKMLKNKKLQDIQLPGF